MLGDNSRWRVVLSSVTQKPFYYDTLTKRGQFTVPAELMPLQEQQSRSSNCEGSNEESRESGITENEGQSNPSSAVKEAPTDQEKKEEEEEVIVIESTGNTQQDATTVMTPDPASQFSMAEEDCWSCSACTYRNPFGRDRCEICHTKSGHKPPRRSQRKISNSQLKISL